MAAGGLLATQAAAQADIVTTNNFGALNGTQVVVPIQAPINICGNSVALIGGAFASCDGGAAAINGGGQDDDRRHQHDDNGYGYDDNDGDDEFLAMAEGQKKNKKHGRDAWAGGGSNIVSSGNYGLLNGTQVVVPIQVPIDVCGNAIGIIGGAFAACDGGAVAVNESARTEGAGAEEGNMITANNFGALNGTQVYAPIQVPIDICGNAIALIGGAFASCDGGAFAINESARAEGAGVEEGNLISTNNFGLGNGTQLYAPIQIPINVCGNAIALIGGAFAQCDGGAIAFNESARAESARDEALPLVGSLPLPVVAGLPVVGQLGQSSTPAAPKMDTAPGARSGATEGDHYDDQDDQDGRHGKHGKKQDGGPRGAVAVNGGKNIVSSNNFGALNGTQVVLPIQAPINVSGNAIGIIGGAFAQSTGGALAFNG